MARANQILSAGRVALIGYFVFLLAGGNAIAQSDSLPKFEVATVKPADPFARGKRIGFVGRSLSLMNYSVKDLMVFGWGIERDIIIGGPAWLDSVRFDILAKPEGTPPQTPLEITKWYGLMVQSVLADRFQLAVHHETREAPVYVLVFVKKDNRLGPKLTEAQGSCKTVTPFQPPTESQGVRPKKPSPGCGTYILDGRHIQGADMQLGQLGDFLAQWVVHRTVIDQAGLNRKFDFDLEWKSDNVLSDSDLSIFTALEEQLGLKLESQKAPVDAVIIDRVEKPSEN